MRSRQHWSTFTGNVEQYMFETLGEDKWNVQCGMAEAMKSTVKNIAPAVRGGGGGATSPTICYNHPTPTLEEMPSLASYYYPFSRQNPAPPPPSSSIHSVRPQDEEATPMKFTVAEMDCVDAAMILAKKDCGNDPSKVAILNMANEWNCGGGFERMGGSQEEYLFRRTSLAVSLWPRRRVGDERWSLGSKVLGRSQEVRPGGVSLQSPAVVPIDVDDDDGEDALDTKKVKSEGDNSAQQLFTTCGSMYRFTECGAVYSPNVEIISTTSTNKYIPKKEREADPLLAKGYGVVSIAAQDLRAGRHYNKGVHFDRELTKQKFRSMLYACAAHGAECLVLGAIGCGAFHNPPADIARMFREVLLEEYGEEEEDDSPEKKKKKKWPFKHVVFAVILSKPNLMAFEGVFGKAVKL